MRRGKKRISVLVDIDCPMNEDELLIYIAASIHEMRGCYAPDDPVHAMKVLAVETHSMIHEPVEPDFGYGYLGDGEFRTRMYG